MSSRQVNGKIMNSAQLCLFELVCFKLALGQVVSFEAFRHLSAYCFYICLYNKVHNAVGSLFIMLFFLDLMLKHKSCSFSCFFFSLKSHKGNSDIRLNKSVLYNDECLILTVPSL